MYLTQHCLLLFSTLTSGQLCIIYISLSRPVLRPAVNLYFNGYKSCYIFILSFRRRIILVEIRSPPVCGLFVGPSEWSVHYPLCGGNAQSPIDIQSSSAVYSSGLTLNFINYDVIGTESFTVINNGHSGTASGSLRSSAEFISGQAVKSLNSNGVDMQSILRITNV